MEDFIEDAIELALDDLKLGDFTNNGGGGEGGYLGGINQFPRIT